MLENNLTKKYCHCSFQTEDLPAKWFKRCAESPEQRRDWVSFFTRPKHMELILIFHLRLEL